MAYTDFANIAAPSFWDEAQSGIYVSDGSAVPSTLDVALTRVTDSLASRWDGTKYEHLTPGDPDTYSRFSMLLVHPGILACSEVFIDQLSNDSDSPSITVYGTDGNVLADPVDPENSSYLLGGTNTGEIDIEDLELGGFRRVYRMLRGSFSPVFPNEPVVLNGIKAILIAGFFDFPQGQPKRLYGIHGPVISGDIAFWTGFSGSPQANPLTDPSAAFNWPVRGQRLTELF